MKATRRICCLVIATLILFAQGCGSGTWNDRYDERGDDLRYEAGR